MNFTKKYVIGKKDDSRSGIKKGVRYRVTSSSIGSEKSTGSYQHPQYATWVLQDVEDGKSIEVQGLYKDAKAEAGYTKVKLEDLVELDKNQAHPPKDFDDLVWDSYRPDDFVEQIDSDFIKDDNSVAVYYNETYNIWVEKIKKDGKISYHVFWDNDLQTFDTFMAAKRAVFDLAVDGGTLREETKKKKNQKKPEQKVIEIDVSAWVAVHGDSFHAHNIWVFSKIPGPITYADKIPGTDFFAWPGKFCDAELRAAAWASQNAIQKLYLVNNSIVESRLAGIATAVLGEDAAEYVSGRLNFLAVEANQIPSAILADADKFLNQ